MGTIVPNMGTSMSQGGLANALFSNVQLRVLNLLFSRPEREFQLTELIKLAHSGRGAVQRELEKLSRSGIVEVSNRGKRKTYRANRQSPVFQELHGLIIKTVGLLEPIRNALRKFRSEVIISFIYGSVAKGTDTANSDIDLMIVGENLNYPSIYTALQKVEAVLHRSVNPNLLTIEEWKRRIAEDNVFLTAVLQQPKLFVIGSERELEGLR
jgi:predicted nucleotidyltransferase